MFCYKTVLYSVTYKKRLVSRINPRLLLKINLQNTWTLQLNNIDQIKSKLNYLQKIIKGPASWSVAHCALCLIKLWKLFFVLNIISDTLFSWVITYRWGKVSTHGSGAGHQGCHHRVGVLDDQGPDQFLHQRPMLYNLYFLFPLRQNKLECLSLANFFSILLSNIRSAFAIFQWSNNLAYFASVSDKKVL